MFSLESKQNSKINDPQNNFPQCHLTAYLYDDPITEVQPEASIRKRELRGLLKLHDEYRKRVITIDGCTITIWPVEEFLSTLWAHQLWR